MDGAWFDCTSVMDSERDDEFYSVYDGNAFCLFLSVLTVLGGIE